jgi:RimJ/RimL family protein N-acetyltransferase
VARDGEPWAAAARRVAATVHGEVFARDLSGDPLVFEVDPDTVVALRPAGRGDLPDLVRWRQSEHVLQWWASDGEPTEENVTAQYGPELDGMTPTRIWIAEVNGRSVGFRSDYRIKDYPDYALLGPDPEAVGVDYAIGEPQYVGRGLGVHVLWVWALRAAQRFPDVATFYAAPDHRNERSLRTLDKLGFRRGIWFDEPRADGSVCTVVGCTLDVRRVLG